MTSSNRIVVIQDPLTLIENWPFIREGYKALADPNGAKVKCTEETFFRQMLKAVSLNKDSGLAMIVSKNNKPLAFVCFLSVINFDEEHHLFVWCSYSTGKCRTAMTELIAWGEQLAKRCGATSIKAVSPRINGSAFRLFERIWGFKRENITFTKEI